jgi:hypothetical protein
MIWLRVAAIIAVLIAAISATGEPVLSIVGAVVFALLIFPRGKTARERSYFSLDDMGEALFWLEINDFRKNETGEWIKDDKIAELFHSPIVSDSTCTILLRKMSNT